MAKLQSSKRLQEDATGEVSVSSGARRINNTVREQRSGTSPDAPQDLGQTAGSASSRPRAVQLFGDDFLWGASTAGHQVEGGNYDQWTVWELAYASELAKTAKKRLGWLPEWEKVKKQAETPENYVSGKGVDHFHRYKEDFDILKSLNLNAFRFGIEWSRAEPEEGVWNKTAFDHYHNYIAELRNRGIEPVLNLWHWTQPVWFEEKGAFEKSGNIGYFLRFVAKVIEEFGEEVKYIITLNEPNVYASLSYITGEWPPQHKSPLKALIVYRNLVKSHNLSYALIKKSNPELRVGVAAQLSNNLPNNPKKMLDKVVAKAAEYGWNWWFLDRIKRRMDFVGFNYYFTYHFDGFKKVDPKAPQNDMGWYMEPSDVGEVATKVWLRYHKPVMVTENGVADAEDKHRQWWLKETMLSLITAQKAGVNLIGYMHWSLLDNFEWAYGWWPKFGLVSVDRENGMKRTIRPSARWFAKQIEHLKSEK